MESSVWKLCQTPTITVQQCQLKLPLESAIFCVSSPALTCIVLEESAASDLLKWWLFFLSSLPGNGKNPHPPQSLLLPPHPRAVRLWQCAHGHEERVLPGRLQKSCGFSQGEVSLLALREMALSFFLPKVYGALTLASQLRATAEDELRKLWFPWCPWCGFFCPRPWVCSGLVTCVSWPAFLRQFQLWWFSYLTCWLTNASLLCLCISFHVALVSCELALTWGKGPSLTAAWITPPLTRVFTAPGMSFSCTLIPIVNLSTCSLQWGWRILFSSVQIAVGQN